MSSGDKCGECGVAIPADSPGGFCARCLLGLGLEAEGEGPPIEDKSQRPELKAKGVKGGGESSGAPAPLSEAGTSKRNVVMPAPLMEKAGDRIGRYRLLEEIGHGGCGVVYMAEQEEPVRRKVALKVIKLGMDTLQVVARFEAERQALALMNHPNIAKVLDAGATATGRPYFVMELVEGIKLTDFCDQAGLTPRQRLELFIEVCGAIQHAHQKGIIHRDIKPSNVLVATNDGRAVPKVIDFGIAKATQGRLTDQTLFTACEQFLGTPAYMSPEQAELGGLDIDTRSDIYSLGVLLYELLTGKTPFDARDLSEAGREGMRRAIREREPPRPSMRLAWELAAGPARRATAAELSASPRPPASAKELLQLLRGDVDWIVMKCLEKDRARRYETANGLAMDVQRHLRHEPLVARPPGTLYRLGKFVHRNRVQTGAALAILTALVLAATISTWQAIQARRAAREALRARQDATAKLWSSYLAEARATRTGSQLGRRFESLKALRQAAAIRPALELRNEAIACLVLTDVQSLGLKDFQASGELVVPDGNFERYAAASSSGAISIRRLSDDQELAHLPALGPAVTYPARFSPDGKLVAFCYADHRLRVWDWAKPEVVVEGWDYCAADFASDSRLLAGSDSTNIVLFDLGRREPVKAIPLEGFLSPNAIGDYQFQFRFHPTKALLAVSGRDQTNVLLLDTQSGKTLMKLPHPKGVYQTAWHPGGRYLAVGCADYQLYVWDAATGERIRTLPCDAVSVLFSRRGNLLAASGWDGESRLLDFPGCRPQVSFIQNGFLAGFSPDDTRLMIWGWQINTLESFGIASGKGLRTIYDQPSGADNHLAPLSFSADGELLAYTTSGGVRLWNVRARRELGAVDGQLAVLGFEGANESLLLTGSSNLLRWPIQDPMPPEPRIIPSATLAPAPVSAVARFGDLSANGRVCAISADTRYQVFRTDTFTEQARTGEQELPHFVAVSPDGSLVATGAWLHPGVRVWDARTGSLVKELFIEDGHQGTCVAFTPDGRRLVTSVGQNYHFWEVGSWALALHIPQSGEYIPARMALSHDGKILAGSVSRKLVRLYDTSHGQVLADLEAPAPGVICGLAFSPDDSLLAVCELRSTVRIWDLRWIREQLASMGLDWDMPPFPASTIMSSDAPTSARVGNLPAPASPR